MRKIEVGDGLILLYTDYDERYVAAALHCARWNSKARRWEYPATPAMFALVGQAFPMAVAEALTKDIGLRALAALEQERALTRARTPAQVADYDYSTPPWAHQIEATRFTRDMDACLLHCHMGTGKTKMVLDAARAREHSTILILCPCSVIDVWGTEAEKHARGHFRTLLLRKGSVSRRAESLERFARIHAAAGQPLLAVMNYEASWRSPMDATILSRVWDCVVFDESQRIKSPGARQSRFCARIRAKHKIATTGTPMPHSPLDVYGQYRALDPAIFGQRFATFRDHYAVMGGYEGHQILGFRNEGELRGRMDLIRHRVPIDALDLPPIQFLDRECELEPAARKIYRQMEDTFIAEVGDGIVTAANALAKLLRLQQIAAGFAPVPVERLTGMTQELREVSQAKANLLRELLEDIGEHYVIVFARFRRDLDVIKKVAERLDRGGVNKCCGEISGRMNEYKEWQNGEFSTLAVQIQAGSLGIDLTRARYVLFYTTGYSLGDYEQAVARLHRPGQGHPVVVYRLIVRGTVDRRIFRALDKRRDVIAAILAEIKEEDQGVVFRPCPGSTR